MCICIDVHAHIYTQLSYICTIASYGLLHIQYHSELTTVVCVSILLQFIAATTYDFVAPVDCSSNSSLALQRRRNPRRPQDFRSGVSTAWNTLTTVRTVIAIASYIILITS